jgi:hypothetical protein
MKLLLPLLALLVLARLARTQCAPDETFCGTFCCPEATWVCCPNDESAIPYPCAPTLDMCQLWAAAESDWLPDY